MPGFCVYMFGFRPFPVPAAEVERGMSCTSYHIQAGHEPKSSISMNVMRKFFARDMINLKALHKSIKMHMFSGLQGYVL